MSRPLLLVVTKSKDMEVALLEYESTAHAYTVYHVRAFRFRSWTSIGTPTSWRMDIYANCSWKYSEKENDE